MKFSLISRELIADSSMGEKVALVTDGRFSGATRGMCIGYACPEAASGGPIALVNNGDRIRIDCGTARMDLLVSRTELARRQKTLKPKADARLGGTLEKYAKLVGPANLGAVTHSGKVTWPREKRLELTKGKNSRRL